MYKYDISIQFKKIAKYDGKAKEKIPQAVGYYNGVSKMARNPKQIEEFHFSDDDMTLYVRLNSEEELPMPSKALRMFSVYLANECGFDRYLSGNNLFKMSVEAGQEKEPCAMAFESNDMDSDMSFEIFQQLSVDEKLNEIFRLLKGVR